MFRLPEEYLKHILDETLQKAFVRSLEIIGEATKNPPEEFTNLKT